MSRTVAVAFIDGLGGPEVLFIGILALLMFGSKRLPELGRAFGRAMREFRRATSGVEQNLREAMREEPETPRIRPPVYRGPSRTVEGGYTAHETPATVANTIAAAPASTSAVTTTSAPATGADEPELGQPDPPQRPDDDLPN
jgi:sec-independent protein translocase protein TatA